MVKLVLVDNPARGGLHIHKAATAELHLTDDTTGSGSGDWFYYIFHKQFGRVWYRENVSLYALQQIIQIGSDGHLSYSSLLLPPAWQVNTGYGMTFGSSAYLNNGPDVTCNFL